MVTVLLLGGALALSGYVLIDSKGKNALAWAVALVVVALLLPRIG